MLLPEFVGQIEIEQHHHPGLGIEAGQGDDPDPDGDRGVVAEQVEKPEGADQGEGHGEKDDAGLDQTLGVEVDDDEDDQNRQRDDQQQPRLGLLHVLELAAPDDVVARRQLDLLLDRRLGVVDVGADVASLDDRRRPRRCVASSRS